MAFDFYEIWGRTIDCVVLSRLNTKSDSWILHSNERCFLLYTHVGGSRQAVSFRNSSTAT